MESPLLSIQRNGEWRNVHSIGWTSTTIFEYIEEIVDQIQTNNRVVRLPEVLRNLPQTEILLSALLRNLSPLILDVVDIIIMKPIHLVRSFREPRFSSLGNYVLSFFVSFAMFVTAIRPERLQISGETMALRTKGERRIYDGIAKRHP